MRKLKNEELDRLDVKEFKKANKTPVIIVLDHIRSLHNIGSVFRSADAFLIEKIYLCGVTATPPNKDIRKTALGATESVSWEYKKHTLEVIQKLNNQGYTSFAVEQAEHSLSLQNFEATIGKKYVLVFGNEVKGVAQEVVNECFGVIEIPQFGTKHSLNIAVSAGIVLWDFCSKIKGIKKPNHRLGSK